MHNLLIERDLKHIFHPCSQMKDFEQHPPIVIERASGSYLYTPDGPIIDAISSWWCKSLGHHHPALIAAIEQQLKHFEHVIGANTTHPKIVELAEKLAALSKKQHVFFASDGSSAVEIALKLALSAQQLRGHSARTEIISLHNSYHGETLATLSVSGVETFKKPFQSWCTPCTFLQNIPYVSDDTQPLFAQCETWPEMQKQLEQVKNTAAAIIVEPIVQGAGGMRPYSADFLKRLAQFAKANDIYLIADEIMTGLGRTGKTLASEYAEVDPDFICLSKGLTGGTLPLSCTLLSHEIYDLFYEDYDKGTSFLHSHTYSGHALAVSAALATLLVMEKEQINEQAVILGQHMRSLFQEIAATSGKLENVRSIGAIVAADLIEHPFEQRIGFKLAQCALKRGALLRPIGRTLYWLPPLNTSETTIRKLAEITLDSIHDAYL